MHTSPAVIAISSVVTAAFTNVGTGRVSVSKHRLRQRHDIETLEAQTCIHNRVVLVITIRDTRSSLVKQFSELVNCNCPTEVFEGDLLRQNGRTSDVRSGLTGSGHAHDASVRTGAGNHGPGRDTSTS